MFFHHSFPKINAFAALLISALICACSFSASAERGDKAFGPRIGFVSQNSSVLAGLAFQISTADHVRIVPEANIFFRNHDKDGLELALNAHFPFSIGRTPLYIYPIAGVEYLSWGLHGIEIATDKDVTSHINRIGINAGAGLELRCSRTLKLSLEGRYSFAKDFSTAQVALGINYIF